jgi:hypothetical protein
MNRPSTSFRLGDVMTGEPHLYVANPPSPSESDLQITQTAPASTHPLRRFIAAVQRTFRLGPTPGDALAAGLDRAFMP